MSPSFFLYSFFTPNAVYVHSPVIPCTYLLLVSDEAFTVLFVQLCLVPCDVLTVLNHVLFFASSARICRMDPASVARSLTSALTNPYSYSSTYNPSHSSTPSFSNRPSRGPSASAGRSFPPRGAPPTHWYTPGNSKCTCPGCTFTGSVKSVQIHMMDRHLIYPPGWHAHKRQSDWDADPSLKGYVLVHTQPGRVS